MSTPNADLDAIMEAADNADETLSGLDALSALANSQIRATCLLVKELRSIRMELTTLTTVIEERSRS